MPIQRTNTHGEMGSRCLTSRLPGKKPIGEPLMLIEKADVDTQAIKILTKCSRKSKATTRPPKNPN